MCDCKIAGDVTGKPLAYKLRVDYCPLHKAAEEMYEALVIAIGAVIALDDLKYPKKWVNEELLPILRQARDKAEEK